MREIKFRGRDGDDWYYGSLFVNSVGQTAICDPKSWWNKLVKAETVGMYTGHSDVMGTDMYEGDIVTGYFDEDEWPAVVEWDEVSARFVLSGQSSVIPFDEMGGLEITIIGNVHDNPELLS